MKKIVATLFLVLVLSGCGNAQTQEPINKPIQETKVDESLDVWDRDGIKFSYPKELTVSADASANIQVQKQTITQLIDYCLASRDPDTGWYEDINRDWRNGLKELKEKGLNKDIYDVDSIGCGWVAGNLDTQPIKINDLNGVVYQKAMAQDYGELDVFHTQLLVVNWYDEVHTLTFSYDFGELGDYIKKNPLVDEEKWDEVLFFFKSNKPIKDEKLKGFEENRKIIENIIKSVEIKKSY